MNISRADQYYRKKLIVANKFFNDILRCNIFRNGNIEEKISTIEIIAEFNWAYHTGRYSSGSIDSFINQITSEINEIKLQAGDNISAVKFSAFIATKLYDTGGHTRLLENIAKYEKSRSRSNILIVCDQTFEKLPQRIQALTHNLFDKIICLGDKGSLDKIKVIRDRIFKSDRVYNFQHPDDAEPSIALNFEERPFTIYVNHADHVFWLGAKYCDCVLNIRPFAKDITIHRRNDKVPSIILPVKIDLNKKLLEKKEARAILRINDDEIVLLTISVFSKVIPDKNYNFFKTIKKVLSINEKIKYYFVGITAEEYKKITKESVPDRLVCMGLVEDPSIYQCAADFYLEGMPINSLTALIESAYAGAFPVLMWGPHHVNMNLELELFLEGIIKHSESEEKYFEYLTEILHHSKRAQLNVKLDRIKNHIKKYNSDEYWDEVLLNIQNNKLNLKESNFREFDTSISDLRLMEACETYWTFRDENPFLDVLNRIKNYFSLPELTGLWFKYIFMNNKTSLRTKGRALKWLLVNR